jgi:hypothetical protein
VARSPKKDPQREEVYRWERNFRTQFLCHEMPLKAARQLIRDVCKEYKIKPPKLLRSRLGPKAYTGAAWEAEVIEVNSSQAEFTAILLAHEVAHVICSAEGYEEPDHGPVWLGLYLYLLDRYRIVPLCATVPSAKAAGLKFRDPTMCSPGRLP